MDPFSINVGILHYVLTSILLYAAHECNLETRNAQYSRICRNVFARSTSTWSCVQPTAVEDEIDRKVLGVASNLVEDSDVVVWLGDLNYRLELPRCSVISMIKSKMQEVDLSPVVIYVVCVHKFDLVNSPKSAFNWIILYVYRMNHVHMCSP